MVASPQVSTGTRSSILDATDRLMATYGFRRITIEDIAREANLSKRTIYLHFKNKVDVGLSSIGRVVENVQEEMISIAASGDSYPSRLEKMLVRRVMGRVEQVQDYAHSLDQLFEIVRPSYMELRQQFFDRECEIISQILERGKANGDFAFADARKAAESMLLATNAFLPYSLSVRQLGTPRVIAVKLQTMVELLLSGVANHSTN